MHIHGEILQQIIHATENRLKAAAEVKH